MKLLGLERGESGWVEEVCFGRVVAVRARKRPRGDADSRDGNDIRPSRMLYCVDTGRAGRMLDLSVTEICSR